jgi:hypothetical protein
MVPGGRGLEVAYSGGGSLAVPLSPQALTAPPASAFGGGNTLLGAILGPKRQQTQTQAAGGPQVPQPAAPALGAPGTKKPLNALQYALGTIG